MQPAGRSGYLREPLTLKVQVCRLPRGVGLAGGPVTGVTSTGTALSGGLVIDCVSSGAVLMPVQW
jgi:hypothetical protein